MATHFSIQAWKVSQAEEPGGLLSVGHKDSDTTEATWHTCIPSYWIFFSAYQVYLKSSFLSLLINFHS